MLSRLQSRTHGLHLGGRRRQHDELGNDAPPRQPVAFVGSQLLRLANHVRQRCELLDERWPHHRNAKAS